MKKILLFFIALFVAVAAQAWTVSFTNPNGWANVNVYTWDAGGSPQSGSWPGSAMTKSGDVWTFTGTTGSPTKIIFNGGGAQTGDLDFVDGATYDMNGPVGAELITYTVSFKNTKNWSNVYVYTYSPDVCGSWPGTKLTQGADGYYTFEYKATSEPSFGGIIFNNGGNGQQTKDLKFIDGIVYDADGNEVGAPMIKYTMSLDNTANWESVYVYTFQPEVCGSWPGTELTKGADGLYTFEYEATSEPTFGGVIFSNGKNSDNGGAQTDDLTFQNGAVVTNGTAPSTNDLYLVGGPAGWDAVNENYKFVKEDNVYTLVIGDGLIGEWKIWNGTWDFNFGGNGSALENGVESDAWFNSGSNFSSNFGGQVTIVFTLVEGSDVNESAIPSKITVTAETVIQPKPMEEWLVSVQGDYNEWKGAGVNPDATGIATITQLPASVADGFKIMVNNGLTDIWHSNGEAIAIGNWVAIPYNSDNNMTIADATEDYRYNISYNCNTDEVKVEIAVQDGIANVAVDANAPAEYFNLQGVRVAQPATGLYIVRQGGKVSKVYVK